MLEQLISLFGAMLILVGYGCLQWNKLRSDDLIYLTLNLTGAVILTIVAVRVRQLGLTVMEAAWALISLASLVSVIRRSKGNP